MNGVNVKPMELTEQEFEEIKTKYDVYYAIPWTDHAFKRVFRSDGQESKHMVSDFLNALLKIEFPNKNLTAREVELQNDVVNAEQQDTHSSVASLETTNSEMSAMSSISDNKPQNLSVDALYSVIIDGFFKPKESAHIFMLVEMQSAKMDFGVRLMQYVASIVNKQLINLKKNKVPFPVLGTGLCMWNIGAFTLGGKIDSADLDHPKKEVKHRTAMYARNIFLNKPIPYGAPAADRLEAREAVRKMIVAHFKKKSYQKLSKEERDVYEWLEFLSCGHLMKPEEVNNLSNEHVKKAYEMNKLNYSDRARMYEEPKGLYKYLEAPKQREKLEKELDETEKELQGTAQFLAPNFVNVTDETLRKFKLLGEKSQKYVIQELKDRYTQVNVSKYEKSMSKEKPGQRTNKEPGKKEDKKHVGK